MNGSRGYNRGRVKDGGLKPLDYAPPPARGQLTRPDGLAFLIAFVLLGFIALVFVRLLSLL